MTRAGVPKWTHVQIKALCQGELEYEKVQKALMKMFGGDHKPNTKDLRTGGKDETFYEEEWEAYDDEDAYEMAEEYGWPEEEAYEADEDEEWPEELDEAYDQCDEAYISYLESRRRMRELALSRGFYPVVAIPPDDNGGGRSSWKGGGGKSKGKGKNKSKNKGKGKGKGASSGFRKTFDNRRPMSGLRRPTTLSSSTGSAESPKSTLTGSNASHGPRFKRYRVQASGLKEVPEEGNMVEELDYSFETVTVTEEHCLFTTLEPGKAIVDSGATRTIAGEDVWKQWLEHLNPVDVKVVPTKRDFRFGGGEILRSHYEVHFPVKVNDQSLPLVVSIVPGRTPFLLSRPTLEAWKAKHDFASGRMQVMDGEWFTPERGHRGHYVFNLLGKYDTVHVVEEIYGELWNVEIPMEENAMDTNDARAQRPGCLCFQHCRESHGGQRAAVLASRPNVTVATFSLPEWDVGKKEVRRTFLALLRSERPHFVWLAPPCTKWSTMQNLAARSPEAKVKLETDRKWEEEIQC